MDFFDGRDINAPLFLAIAIVAGPALFWSFIGLGYGMSALGWAVLGLLENGSVRSCVTANPGAPPVVGRGAWL
jgi:hypothetical protein